MEARQGSAQIVEETEQLAFIWYFAQQRSGTLQRCTPIQFQFEPVTTANGSTVPFTPPFYFIATPAAGPPIMELAVNSINDTFTWNVSLPMNSQTLISFIDSNGGNGGTGPLYTIVGPENNCWLAPPPNFAQPVALSFSLNSENPQTCTPLTASITGGTPPYTMTVFKSADRPVNITGTAGQTSLTWVNTLSASGNVIVGVSDANGLYANDSDVIYSQGGPDISCLISHNSGDHINPDIGGGSHSIWGAAVGGAVGGAAVLAIIAMLVWWFRRRKQAGNSGRGELSLQTDLPILHGFRPHRLESISSQEKLQILAGTLRGSDNSPVSSPSEDRTYDFSRVIRSNSRRSQSSLASGNPDYFSAIQSRSGPDSGSATYRSTRPGSSEGLTVRQHQDAGTLSGTQRRVVDLPPSYGAFSGSAEMAAAADLASVRPKGNTGDEH